MDLNFKTFGQGDPVIILHGLFGALDNWQTLARRLADHYSVYIVDLRNHGRSPHQPTMTYPEMAEDLLHFMESRWIYEAHLIGHSMGGKTAMQFALEYPDFLKKLIVVDISPKQYPSGHDEIFDALLSLDLDRINSRQEAEEALSARIKDAGITQFLLKNLTRKEEGKFAWKMNLPVLHEHYDEILAEIEGREPFSGPTLFIRGSRSDYIKLTEDRDLILRYFPNAVLKTVENAGHWVHAEQPEATFNLIRQFLQDA